MLHCHLPGKNVIILLAFSDYMVSGALEMLNANFHNCTLGNSRFMLENHSRHPWIWETFPLHTHFHAHSLPNLFINDEPTFLYITYNDLWNINILLVTPSFEAQTSKTPNHYALRRITESLQTPNIVKTNSKAKVVHDMTYMLVLLS